MRQNTHNTSCSSPSSSRTPRSPLPVFAMPAKPRTHGFTTALHNVYNDPWKWQLVKSWTWFAAGIYIAREITASLNEPLV